LKSEEEGLHFWPERKSIIKEEEEEVKAKNKIFEGFKSRMGLAADLFVKVFLPPSEYKKSQILRKLENGELPWDAPEANYLSVLFHFSFFFHFFHFIFKFKVLKF